MLCRFIFVCVWCHGINRCAMVFEVAFRTFAGGCLVVVMLFGVVVSLALVSRMFS